MADRRSNQNSGKSLSLTQRARRLKFALELWFLQEFEELTPAQKFFVNLVVGLFLAPHAMGIILLIAWPVALFSTWHFARSSISSPEIRALGVIILVITGSLLYLAKTFLQAIFTTVHFSKLL
jgi:hypothetical protein